MLDSEILLGLLNERSFTIVDEAESADIAIVNTCGFIEDAKKESIDIILQLAELKKEGIIQKLIVAGCLSQRYPDELKGEIKEIDGIFGSSDFIKIPGFLNKLVSDKGVKEVTSTPDFLYDHTYSRNLLTLPHYAYVKIQEGCSNRCTYCVIPDLKGPRRSRDIGSVVKEVEKLRTDHDIKEAVIIGQDTTSFGLDRSGQSELAALLREVTPVMKDRWIRLLYTHPAHFTDDLIDVMTSNKNICKYVDLPVQHINSDILKKMNRMSTAEEIKTLIDRLRRRIDDVTLRTSIIVGFPGETEDMFNELLDFLEKVKFDRLGAFIYSKEEGTPAYGFPDQVPEEIKRERFDKVMRLQQDISADNNTKIIGKTLKTLIDETINDDPSQFIGRSEKDAPEVDGVIFVKGKDLKPGDFVDVKITGTMEYDMTGDAT